MRKWAVRALTPPTAADEAQVPSISTEQKAEASLPATGKPDSQSGAQAEVTRNKQATTPTPSGVESGQLNKKAGTEEESKQAQRVDSESIARQPAENRSKPDDKAEKRSEVTNGPPPIKREKRPESPGLASRLDRPLSQPAPREPRPRRGRTPPAMQSSRRSPSPDAQRKRPASQHGPSLAERMGGGQRGETSLLSRMGENGKADNNRRRDPPSDGRPPKRSKKDDVKDSGRDSADMQIDSDQLASRVQAPRSRSQSPPANSRGIAILGASRNRPSAPSGGSESTKPAATNTPKEEESAQQRVLPQGTSSLIGSEVTEGKSDDANTKDTSTVSSNGLPPRPAGFASLPPKPPVVVPPPSFTTRGPPRGGSSTPNPALLDSYRPGPPPRRPSSRGLPAQESYQPGPPKDAPFIDRYVPRREPPPTRGPRVSGIQPMLFLAAYTDKYDSSDLLLLLAARPGVIIDDLIKIEIGVLSPCKSCHCLGRICWECLTPLG